MFRSNSLDTPYSLNLDLLEESNSIQRHASDGIAFDTIDNRPTFVSQSDTLERWQRAGTGGNRFFSKAVEMVGGKGPKPHGEVVVISNPQNPLPMQAFEISDEFKKSMSQVSNYHFTRSARRSLMLGLGKQTTDSARTSVGPVKATDVIDPYTKVDDTTCMYNYMGVIIGFGALGLPEMLAHCGIIPGLIAIICFGCLNGFWAHRIIELPMLVTANLERYGDIAKICFPKFYWTAFCAIIATWYGYVLLNYFSCLYYSRHHVVKKFNPVLGYTMEVVFSFVFLCLSFRSGVKENHRRGVWGMQIMYMVLFLVAVCSFCHGLTNFNFNTYDVWGGDWEQIMDGMLEVGLSFTGLGIIPYIVSEMLHPENARYVVTRASRNITAYYVAFALVGYLGWGKDVNGSVAREIERLGETNLFYRITSTIITISLLGKFVLVFPIIFLPLIRELEGFLQLDDSPPIDLGLPWAIRRLSFIKMILRVLLVVFSTVAVYQLSDDFVLVSAICNVPFNLTQMVLPAIFTLRAMAMWHHRLRLSGEKQDVERKKETFGAHMWQVVVTGTLAVVSMGLGMVAILESAHTMLDILNEYATNSTGLASSEQEEGRV